MQYWQTLISCPSLIIPVRLNKRLTEVIIKADSDRKPLDLKLCQNQFYACLILNYL